MGRLSVMLGIVLFIAMVTSQGAAEDRKFPQGDARRSMGNHVPKTAHVPNRSTFAPQQHGQSHSSRHDNGHGSFHRQPSHFHLPYNYYRRPYGYGDYRYGSPYPSYYRSYYYQPFVRAGVLFGPAAMRRFMDGGANVLVPNINNNIVILPNNGAGIQANRQAAVPRAPVAAIPPRPGLADAGQKAAMSAWKYVGFGDALFADRKYSDAYIRYRKAARAAPEVADIYFRQGYALLAMGHYDLAAKALKRGLEINPAWALSDFDPDEFYGGDVAAKASHLAALSQAETKDPRNPDLLFLLGVLLHFDGQAGKAIPYFERAAQLNVGNDDHIEAFLGL